MKSILFVVLIASAISSSFAVKIKGSCPKPEKPKVDDWDFDNFVEYWNVIGRSEDTDPLTARNTLEIYHLYPGKVAVSERGSAIDSGVESYYDKYMTMIVGDFDGRSYYEAVKDEQPYSFNFTTSDGNRGQFWMPYANLDYDEAVLASCVEIDDSTVDVKAWFVSMSSRVSASQEVKDLIKSLTGQDYIKVCRGNYC